MFHVKHRISAPWIQHGPTLLNVSKENTPQHAGCRAHGRARRVEATGYTMSHD